MTTRITLEAPPELGERDFRRVSELLYGIAGITMSPGKEGLVRSRLMRRLHELGVGTFDAYLRRVEGDATGGELATMVDLLTTNKTSFFREAQHFDFLRAHVFPALAAAGAPARLWSAGCSSGEEAYTLAIVAREALGGADVRILATDISARVLAKARAGAYPAETVAEVPPPLLRRYFTADGDGRLYRVTGDLRDRVSIARLNLMGAWPMRGPFDAIFCRNVMIYFDKPTQERLVNRFWQLLAPGGYLFVGHSESLSALSHQYAYVQPAVYRR